MAVSKTNYMGLTLWGESDQVANLDLSENFSKISQDLGARAINVVMQGVVPGGQVDNTSLLQRLVNTTAGNDIILHFPAGNYRIDGKVTIAGKNVILTGAGRLVGTGVFSLTAASIEAESNALDVTSGDYLITSSGASNLSPGDYIQIRGAIVHSDYVPAASRYPNVKFIAIVDRVDGNIIRLDRKLMYSLSNVFFSKINAPYNATITDGLIFDGVGVLLQYCKGGEIRVAGTGIRTGSSLLTVNQSCDLKITLKASNLLCTHAMTVQDTNNFWLDVLTTNVGTPGVGSRAIRGNGLQGGLIRYTCNNSVVGDVTIYSSRSINLDATSIGVGRYYRDNGIVSNNRLECIQFTETDDLQIKVNLSEVDDQGVELHSCFNSEIEGRITTLPGATEGAIVIKGFSRNVTIKNIVIRCYNHYGIKFEYADAMYGGHRVIAPDIENLNPSSRAGISIRDALVAQDANVEIVGGIISAFNPVLIAPNLNRVSITGSNLIGKGGHVIGSESDFLYVDRITVRSPVAVHAVVSAGPNDRISNVLAPNCDIYIKTPALNGFDISRFPFNSVLSIGFEGVNWIIYCDKNPYQVNTAPTRFNWQVGHSFDFRRPTRGGKKGIVCIEAGTPGIWKSYGAIDV
ncbi:glycosyl hydrolase family 28-related protein [Paenibacillus methanolicus]|uniref:Pectate lyase-like protein n=1 Tax=Paenibacillus methanolicus TaxID=582686 RepID=A0A5S5BTD6_9BACL|nr:glycosyl hydrolase family 28-related protein [Paenibacillus methanolicus]TYP70277.1 pectate lyase-like protein [Paenibacillus methanolicus]